MKKLAVNLLLGAGGAVIFCIILLVAVVELGWAALALPDRMDGMDGRDAQGRGEVRDSSRRHLRDQPGRRCRRGTLARLNPGILTRV